jgi:hypothetical protein
MAILDNKYLNVIDVNFNQKKYLKKFQLNQTNYINKCFEIAIKLIKSNISKKTN